MNKQKTNNYETACNAVNSFLDTMLGAFGVDTEKYHLTEEKLRDAVENSRESLTSAVDELTDTVKLYKEKCGIDFTDLANTLNTVLDEYSKKYNINKEGNTEDDVCLNDDEVGYNGGCEFCPLNDDEEVELVECDGDCEFCPLNDDTEEDKFDYRTVANNLKSELDTVKESLAYPYKCIWKDLYVMLNDPDEHEIVTDDFGNSCIQVVYHVGYDTDDQYNTIIGYVDTLTYDLKTVYGFNKVYISSERNDIDMYVTLYIHLNF